MKKITNFIVDKRNFILFIFIVLAGVCLYTSTKVNINSDIMKYLPSTSETKIGKNIMDSEFEEQKSSTLNVMFKDLTKKQKDKNLKSLKKLNGVSNIECDNNGKYTLYTINVNDYVHSKTAENIYKNIKENYDFEAMSGSIYEEYKPVLQLWIIFVAIAMAMVILTILSKSYIEPWLYLISIGIAVFLNKGTNIIFSDVSSITNSISAILQLALSMDYSIMLSNRYRQEREKEKDKSKAMKSALYDSFKAISSSSITTVVGLLALVFMSFTIGKDLGFVLAKGVVLSLISIFFCLPALLLMCDRLIINSKKKGINLNLTKVGEYSYKTRYGQLIFIIILFISCFLLKGNLGILYTDSEQDEVAKHFPATNQIAIVYENKYEDIMAKYCKSIENNKKIDQALCYGNTINEKLAYNELNDKFKELGQDTKLDDYLIKVIYYNYYNKGNNDSMSLNQFIRFIKSDVYTNEKLSSLVDNSIKDNITLLENFSTKEAVNKKRSESEIANILGISKLDVNDLLIYYNSKNLNTKMTIGEFVNFMLDEVINDPRYSSNIDVSTISSLKRLKPFVNKDIINKKMTSNEIANTFGIDENLVKQIFLFYRTTVDTNSTMTLNQFSTIAMNLKDDASYSNMFTNDMLQKLSLLQKLSNDSYINAKYNPSQLFDVINSIGMEGLDENTINMLYFYNYYLDNLSENTYSTTTKLSLNQFVSDVINDDSISLLLPDSIKNYKSMLLKFSNEVFITTKLNRVDMYMQLSDLGFSEEQVNMVYAGVYKKLNPFASDEEAFNNMVIRLTPYDFISIVKSSLNQEDPNYLKLNLLINIMDLVYNQTYKVVPTYDYQTLFNYLSNISDDIDINTISLGYGYYDYKNSEDSSYKMLSLKDVINLLEENKNDPLISSKVGNNWNYIELAAKIINNTSNEYSYKELSNLINQEESVVKNIYGVADYNQLTTKLSPIQFTNLILNNKNNNLLSSKLDDNTISSLNLIKLVMNSSLNDDKFSSNDLSRILSSNTETLSLVMSLYDSKYTKSSQSISLVDFTNFIISDVISDPKFSSKFNEDSKSKLNTINAIMKNTLNDTTYNSLELYNVFNKLSDKLNYNLVDLVYIYHGSENLYDDSWKLTVEEIVNYVNDDLLKDEKFHGFIDNNMEKKIKDAKTSISTAKNLLVTNKYSRLIINTKYGFEDKDTFAFVQNALDTVGKNDGIYVIGDSPMAVEISKSFSGELNYITILTMLFIFLVVAFTFKDLLIPIVLVLIIQCAVFVTMSILSVTSSGVYFIALLIVQAILMGATIDYAIVYTTYYKECRLTMNVKDSIINAYNRSIHTIISSSSILIIVTLIVSSFAEAIPAKICETISQGTLCSVILIIFVLPGVLATLDKFICRKNVYKDSKKLKKLSKAK